MLIALVSLPLLLVLSLVPSPLTPPLAAAPVTVAETAAAAAVGDKVNINTADVKELMTLKGIGQKVAERIVEYREAHGLFKKPEDLRKVEGVGAGLWERNRERVVTK